MTGAPFARLAGGIAVCVILAASLAACGAREGPARQMLAAIATALVPLGGDAAADAARYAPGRLAALQADFGTLKGEFDRGDYAGVLREGPAVLAAVQQLEATVNAGRTAAQQQLQAEWTQLSGAVPEAIARLERGAAPPATHNRLVACIRLWSKAQAAFAAGNLTEAVAIAREAATGVAALAEPVSP